MIVLTGHAHLRALGMTTGFLVALPDSACAGGPRIPYALCLHDYGQNGERLLQTMNCATLVDERNVALLLPDGQNGCFLDMAHGPKWETYLMQGLLPFAERTFPLQKTPKVFGLGTGGWAAARLAASYPERFAAALAADADANLPARYADGTLAAMPDLEAALGDPAKMPVYPLSGKTVWAAGVPAAQGLFNTDWSSCA